MKLILAAAQQTLARAWEMEFREVRGVEIHRGSIFEPAADALVSPANSFGFMDGGIDALYSSRRDRPRSISSLIRAPTMRVPMILNRDNVNPFLAVRAELLSVRYGVLRTELHNRENARDHIRTVAFPGMGTGVGQIPARLCARQMRAALDCVTNEKLTMPSSRAEASEQHQLLYSDRPKRPQ